jgi:hypothetical protein
VRRLHARAEAEAVPSTFHHPTDEGQRITTPASANVSELLARHLNKTFAPLEFPPTLAQRILTHLSHHDSAIGHNSRFAFLGVFYNDSSHFLSVSYNHWLLQGGERSKLTSYSSCKGSREPPNTTTLASPPVSCTRMSSVNTLLLIGDYMTLCAGSHHAQGNPDLMVGRRVFIKSLARQLRQLSEGYYTNLSVKISCTALPFPLMLELTN